MLFLLEGGFGFELIEPLVDFADPAFVPGEAEGFALYAGFGFRQSAQWLSERRTTLPHFAQNCISSLLTPFRLYPCPYVNSLQHCHLSPYARRA
jgi:hypothetical protein